MRQINNGPFLTDDDGRKIAGVENPDGSESEFLILKNKFSRKVAIGIAGQSVEMGASYEFDLSGTSQLAGLSAPSQGIFEPLPGADRGRGSPFVHLAEMLTNDGIDVSLYNGAVGSSSFIYDWCGTQNLAGRANSTAYRGKRASEGVGDPGHRGDFIYVNGAVWEATTGNRHLVFTKVPLVFNGTTYYHDIGVVPNQPGGVKETALTSAASPPVFPGSPVVGNTVTDGGIVWTCTQVAAKTEDSPGTNIRVIKYDEDGFDPYFMLTRVRDNILAIPVTQENRYIYFQNAQSDAGQPTALYTQALRWMCLFMMRSPYRITAIFGLSIFYIGSSTSAYDTVETTLSNGGINSAPDYANSPLTTQLAISAYVRGIPGTTRANFSFFYAESLYRYFGKNVGDLGLYSGQPHPNLNGAIMIARAMYPKLRQILLNVAV